MQADWAYLRQSRNTCVSLLAQTTCGANENDGDFGSVCGGDEGDNDGRGGDDSGDDDNKLL